MQTTGFLKAFWALTKPYWVSEQRAQGTDPARHRDRPVARCLVWLEGAVQHLEQRFLQHLAESSDQAEFFRQLGMFTLLAFDLHLTARLPAATSGRCCRSSGAPGSPSASSQTGCRTSALLPAAAARHAAPTTPTSASPRTCSLFVELTLSLSLGLLSAVVTLVSFVAILWTLSGALELCGHHHPRLHGVGGAALRGRRHLAHARDRQAADRPRLRPAALRGRFPLLAGAAAREQRGRGAVPRRKRGARRFPQPLRRGDRATGGADAASRSSSAWFTIVLRPARDHLSLRGRRRRASSPARSRSAASSRPPRRSARCRARSPGSSTPTRCSPTGRRPVDRLIGFSASLEQVRAEADQLHGERAEGADESLALEDLELELPQGTTLLAPHHARAQAAASDVLVTGPSGSGKSTFFRALAGHLALLERPHRAAAGRAPAVPAAEALPADRHAQARGELSRRPGEQVPDARGARRAARGRPRRSSRASSSAARTGRRCSRAASSSGSRSRARCFTGPTGCSSTRRRRRCRRRTRTSSTRC